jgi:hypothetical protein
VELIGRNSLLSGFSIEVTAGSEEELKNPGASVGVVVPVVGSKTTSGSPAVRKSRMV